MKTLVKVDNLSDATHIEMIEDLKESGLSKGEIYKVNREEVEIDLWGEKEITEQLYVIDDNRTKNYTIPFVKHVKYKIE